MNIPSSLKSSIMERHLLMKPCNKFKELLSIWPTSYVPPPTSKGLWWQTLKKKRPPRGPQSSNKPSKSSTEITKQGTVHPMSSILHHDQSKDLCSSMGMPLSKTSSKEQCSSMRTLSPSIPPLCLLRSLIPSCSSLLTPTSSCPHEPACHIWSTQDHHHPLTTRMK